MPTLRVDLQEGFAGDTVQVRLNGKELLREPGVRTRLQTGLARLIETEAQGEATLEIAIEERQLRETIRLNVSSPTYVGVSVKGNGLVHQVSGEPFGYL